MKPSVLQVFAAAGLNMAMAVVASGQVELDLKLEHSVTLQYEPVMAFVSIRNTGPRPLEVGGTASNALDIGFVVRSMERNDVLDRMSPAKMAQHLTIGVDQKQDAMVDVSRFYNLAGMGRYMVTATMTVRGRAYESQKVMLDIVKGLVLETMARPLPDAPERTRTYTLRYWAREGKESLFLSAADADPPANFALINLGHIVRVTPAKLEVDRAGNVTVSHQSSADIFTRSILRSRTSGVHLVDQLLLLRDGTPYVPKETTPGAGDATTKTPIPAKRISR